MLFFAVGISPLLTTSLVFIQIQVCALDIFCREDVDVTFPKDPAFTPLVADDNPAKQNVIQVGLPLEEDQTAIPQTSMLTLSIGFMQQIMELFTVPGDVVLDMNVGLGNSFIAGDYSGRYVVGLEDRPRLSDFAAETCKKTLLRNEARRSILPQIDVIPLAEAPPVPEASTDPFAALDDFAPDAEVTVGPTPLLPGVPMLPSTSQESTPVTNLQVNVQTLPPASLDTESLLDLIEKNASSQGAGSSLGLDSV